MVFVEEKRHGEIPDLLFRVFVGRYEADGLEVAKVDVPSQNIDIKQLWALC